MAVVLVVEDDKALSMGIEYALREEGYDVRLAGDCQSARRNAELMFDIALLDVMLPDGNGYDLLEEFRQKGMYCPVIFLTAISDEGNIVRGLDLGADDYITKPFRVKELMSRIRAVLRRSAFDSSAAESEESQNERDDYQEVTNVGGVRDSRSHLYEEENVGRVLRCGDLILDPERTEAWICEGDGNKTLFLTKSEYRLLYFLMRNKGRTLERSMILGRLFDDESSFVDDNTLSVYINRLREKIGDTKREKPYIQTVRGVGYRFIDG